METFTNEQWLTILTGIGLAGSAAIAFLFKIQHSRSEKIEDLFHEQQKKLVDLSREIGELSGHKKGTKELAEEISKQLVDQVASKFEK